MSELSDYVRLVSEPHAAKLTQRIAALQRVLLEAAPIVKEIEFHEPSMGEDDDEIVPVRLGDIKALRRAIKAAEQPQ